MTKILRNYEQLDKFFNRSKILLLLLITFLEGCVNSNSALLEKSVRFESKNSAINVNLPSGFCIDKGTIGSEKDNTTFFIINCVEVKKGSKVSLYRRPISVITSVILSSQIAEDQKYKILEMIKEKDLKNLSKYYRSNSQVSIVKSYIENEVLYVLFKKKLDEFQSTTGPLFWKAILVIDRRLIILTSQGFSKNPKNREATNFMQENIKSFVASINLL